MTRDQWLVLLEVPAIREVIDYIESSAVELGETVQSRVVRVMKDGMSRRKQLDRYGGKRKDPGAQFRPYAPIKASPKTRIEVKRRAQAEGIAPAKAPQCGSENVSGERCWLPPHRADVPHKF